MYTKRDIHTLRGEQCGSSSVLKRERESEGGTHNQNAEQPKILALAAGSGLGLAAHTESSHVGLTRAINGVTHEYRLTPSWQQY